jgi:hypothetical protein
MDYYFKLFFCTDPVKTKTHYAVFLGDTLMEEVHSVHHDMGMILKG